MSRKSILGTVTGVAILGTVVAMVWFAPWKAFTNTTVADELPPVVSPTPATSDPQGTPTQATPTPGGNRLLAQGTFVSHAHQTTGSVQLVELATGGQQLLIRDLRTSDGPDVRVWLTDQPAPTAKPYNIYAGGRYLELGPLKGNIGDLVYDVPAGTDLTSFTSVDLWCKRFSVSFGAAALHT